MTQDSEANDNTWLDGTSAPAVLQQQRSQPGSRRPPHRRFRPGRHRVNSFQETEERATSPSATGQDFHNTGRGGATGLSGFQDGSQTGFGLSGGADFQDFADADFGRRGFGQNRVSDLAPVQNDFLDSPASGLSHSLTHPGQRQQFRTQQNPFFSNPVRGRSVFSRPGDHPTAPSALVSSTERVTAPSQTDRFRSHFRRRPSLRPSHPTTTSVPDEDIVTGRSIGRGPVTIVSTGTSVQPTSPTFEDTTPATTEQAGFSWAEPTIEPETTTRHTRRPSLPEVADLPPDLVDRRHPHARSSTSLSEMLNDRKHSSEHTTEKHHGRDLRHRIQHSRVTEATETASSATPTTTSTRTTTSAASIGEKVAAGDRDWRAGPWTTSFEKAAARGSVLADDEDVSLDSITEMVVATTTPQPTPATLGDEEPRLPLQTLFDNL